MPHADSRTSTSKNTVQRLREMIKSGAFAPGMQLPPQRELAAELEVSRPSLREALSVLETLGVLRTEAGQGTFVADLQEEPEQQSWSFASRYSLQEVYQFRFVAEGYAARLAAMRVTDDDVAGLGEILNEHRRAVRENDPIASAQHDFAFHQIIMQYSGNKVFVDLHASYRKALLESQFLPAKRKDRLWEAIVEHENILRTLAHRDSEGANYFMHVHITRAADRVGIMLNDIL